MAGRHRRRSRDLNRTDLAEVIQAWPGNPPLKRKPPSRDLHLPLIERVYLAFAHVTRPINMEYSPLKDAVLIGRLMSTPKRDIADADIGYYSASALTTVGNAEDYRFFLPRILETIINDVEWREPSITVDRLEMAGWTAWSAEERDIILEVAELAAARDEVRDAVPQTVRIGG